MRKAIHVPLDEALCHPQLLGGALGNASTWQTWLVALGAAAGLPLNAKQAEIFATISGGRKPPKRRVREMWSVIGRGSGKSKIAGAINAHVATLVRHKLSKGEVGYVLCLSPTVQQAAIVFGYTLAFLQESPILRQQIVDVTRNEIRLKNNIIISVHPNSYRSVRGRSLLAVVADEISFWRDETSALPDVETYRAIMPSLLRTNGILVAISTPYAKRGLLYEKYRDYFGTDNDDVLVLQGSSAQFNPTLNEADIAQAMKLDPEGGLAEWAGEFRSGISGFLDDADIDAAIDFDRPVEIGPRHGITYGAFVDPSGGRADAMTIAISHTDGERVIIDCLRGRSSPFDPRTCVEEFCSLLKEYAITTVVGDNFSAQWCTEAFADFGIKYTRSELPKSKLYVEGLPLFTRRILSLPDHAVLLRELKLLERRSHSGGRETVDHPRHSTDDYANAVFGALRLAQKPKQRIRTRVFSLTSMPGVPVRGCEIDGVTGERIDHPRPRTRVRWINVDEQGNILKARY